VTIQCEKADGYSKEQLARYGEVTEQTATGLTLKVKRDRVITACKDLLDDLPVTDIDIQEIPIEDVIRRIFTK
jgi:ABC-2 type transport system ATP-binding protein